MVRSCGLAELNLLSTMFKRDQCSSQNGPLDFGDATDKEIPAQGATARNITGEQGRNELDGFRVCLFELDNISNKAIERFDGVLIEQGVKVSRKTSPVVGCTSVSGGYQSSIETMECGGELA